VSPTELAAVLRAAFVRAVRGFDLAGRVRAALAGVEARRVLAVGKAAPSMLAGAWRRDQEALLVVPDGIELGWVGPSTRVLLSDHPLPTERSVAAARAAVGLVGRGDVVALISGGASSLLSLPVEGLDLAAKRSLAEALISSGVPIRDINVVRRHLSQVKGGGLARAGAGRILTLIASDVIAGGPHDVGSGPTVVDPTTIEEARAVLDRLGLDAPLVETLKPFEARAAALEHRFIARPEDLAAAVREELEEEGLTVFELPPTEDDVESLARAYAGLAASLNSGQALVRSAEPTVRVPARAGQGGRSSHLAALAAPLLPEGVALLCGASDGVDGASGAAGAVVTKSSLSGLDVTAALRSFDTGSLHRAAGTSLESRGPTGLNLCDVHIVARA
jgi:glycerate 2-kinase